MKNFFNRKAFGETFYRILKKLLVVVIGVLAFGALRWLENAKSDYDKERAQPIVIVDVDPTQRLTNQEYAIKLESPRLQAELEKIIYPPAPNIAGLKQKENVERMSPGVMALDTLSGRIRESIREARRSPFENQEKFVSYLNDRIISAKDAADKQLTDTKNKRTKWFEELRGKSHNPEEFISTLKRGSDKEFIEKFEQARNAPEETSVADQDLSDASIESSSVTKIIYDLSRLAMKVEDERAVDDHRRISDAAYQNMNGLHSQFVPGFLIQYVKDQKNNSPHPNSLSEMVLDERRGGHVIYQVFYLAFLGVLVFGVLFPIYLLLRALPPFASSVEPLNERAKDLLSRKGLASVAAPEILKTVALSAAAIGIGAAVVIGNNPVTSTKNTADENAIAAAHENSFPPRPGARPPGATPSPGTVTSPSPDVTPTPTPSGTEFPQPSATPIFLSQTFTIDSAKVTQLGQGVGTLQTNFDNFQRRVDKELPSKATVQALETLETSLRPRVDDIVKRTEDLEQGDVKLTKEVKSLSTDVSTIRTSDIPKLEKDVSTKFAATNSAITGFREGTQGRSIGSRAKELLGRERYQVTQQSFDILHNLLCASSCGAGTPENSIDANLSALIRGNERMRKDTFLKRLGISRSGSVAPSPWEAVILRYSRVPY